METDWRLGFRGVGMVENIWSIHLPTSSSLLAGLMVAGTMGLFMNKSNNYFNIYREINQYPDDFGKNFGNHEYLIYNIDYKYDVKTIIWLGIVRFGDIPKYNISHSNTVRNTDSHKHSIWIWNGFYHNERIYDLYEVDEEQEMLKFLQGILTMCQAFNINVNEIILACPIYNEYPYRIDGINLPILPFHDGDDLIYSLDVEGTMFPILGYDEGNNLVGDEYYHNKELTDEEYNYNYP